MKTAELCKAGNVYRAMGGECWLATFDATGDQVRILKPLVRKVIVHDLYEGTVRVWPATGQSYTIHADAAHLHDDRAKAEADAIRQCEELDGTTVMGAMRYEYRRPKPKALKPEYRVRQRSAQVYCVEWRTEGQRWQACFGLFDLTKWKATDCVKRLTKGQSIPGFWQMPGTMEFLTLVDQG